MGVTISASYMTSDLTPHWAWRDAGDPGMWCVTWLPTAQRVDRNQAITAMTLAEAATTIAADMDTARARDHGLWPFICNWADELGRAGGQWAFSMALSLPLDDVDPDAFVTSHGQVQDLATGEWLYVAAHRAVIVAAQQAEGTHGTLTTPRLL